MVFKIPLVPDQSPALVLHHFPREKWFCPGILQNNIILVFLLWKQNPAEIGKTPGQKQYRHSAWQESVLMF